MKWSMLSQSFSMRIFPHICIPFSLYSLFYVSGAPIIKRGVQMVERELNRTLGKRREKKEGRLVFPAFFVFSSLIFRPRSTIWTPGKG